MRSDTALEKPIRRLGAASRRPYGRFTQVGKSWLEPVGTAVLGLLAFFVYVSQSSLHQDVALLFAVYALMALGVYVPVVLGGQIDLAYNAYFAIGAYSVAVLANRSTWPILVSIPIAIVLSMIAASIIGFVTRNLSGFHLALATLAFGFAAFRWVATSTDVTGGAAGLGNIPRAHIFGYELGRSGIVVLGFILVWAVALGLSRFRSRIVGVSARLQRESPVAAESCGVPTRRLQILCLGFGAGIASLGGVLFALMNQFVLADSFTLDIVFIILFMPFLGGVGTPWGAVFGALIVTAITEGGSSIQGPGALVFGLVTLFVLVAAPEGLLGMVRRFWLSGLGLARRAVGR